MDRLAPPDGGKKEELRGRLRGGDLLVWFLLVAGAAVMAFPLYWMFATAVRPKKEIFSGGFDLVPSTLVWSNFSDAWNKLPWDQFYINSIAIALIAVVVTVFINLLAGYTFAKYKFPGHSVLAPAVYGEHPRRADRGGPAGRSRRVHDLPQGRPPAILAGGSRADHLYLHVAVERLRLAAGGAPGTVVVHGPTGTEPDEGAVLYGLDRHDGHVAALDRPDAAGLHLLPALLRSGHRQHGNEVKTR